jgi:hypothetical protein
LTRNFLDTDFHGFTQAHVGKSSLCCHRIVQREALEKSSDLCKSVSRISVAAARRRCVSSRLGVSATALKIPPQKLKDAKKLEGFTSS